MNTAVNIFIIIVGAAFCLFIGAIIESSYHIPKPKSEQTTERRFEVGDCIIYTKDWKEAWEDPYPIERIMQIGHAKYAACFMESDCDMIIDGTGKPHSVGFSDEEKYTKTSCYR